MQKLTEITNENVQQEVFESSSPVIVDVYADWCNPCKMLSPILEELSEKFSELKIVKANMEDNESLISDYSIASLPTLLFFQNGTLIKRLVGIQDKTKLETEFEGIVC